MQSVLAKLSLCRTRALGGKTYQCGDCNSVTEVFHSCGDRHCSQCSGCKRYDFAERAEQSILKDVTYYQVVFTLPSQLSEMALANRETMADSRIMAADAHQVTFLAREGKQVGGERQQVPVTIPTLEFVRRWCEHIQPDQLTRTQSIRRTVRQD